MKRLLMVFVFSVAAVMLAGCGLGRETAEEGPVTIRLMTHDSFDISAEVLEAFQTETGHTVEVFKAGDGGAALNQAILAKDSPLADVFFGVDNTFLSRALENDLFVPYESPLLAEIDDQLEVDAEYRALPVDYGDVCLNYDVAWFAESGLEPPQILDDLADPAYVGLTVVENPATSTPGLAFLIATIHSFGEDGYLDYWQNLVDNDVLVVDGWEQAYYSHFTAASDGDRPIVVGYASSPPAEVYFAETPPEEAPTAAVTTDGTCFRQIEFVGILQGTEHEAAARQLVDFMLSKPFQEDIPLHMFVWPANTTAALPEVFEQYSKAAEKLSRLTVRRGLRRGRMWCCGDGMTRGQGDRVKGRKVGRLLIFALPVVFFVLFYFYPLGSILRLSLFPEGRLALDALRRLATGLLTDGVFVRVFWFTLWQAAVSTVLTVLLALPGAYVLARYRFRGKELLRVVVTLPFVLPTVVVASAFVALLGPQGVVNSWLVGFFGLAEPPIQLINTFWIILLAHVFYNYSVAVRMISTYWQNLSPSLTQAAQMLGASMSKKVSPNDQNQQKGN